MKKSNGSLCRGLRVLEHLDSNGPVMRCYDGGTQSMWVQWKETVGKGRPLGSA